MHELEEKEKEEKEKRTGKKGRRGGGKIRDIQHTTIKSI